MVKELKANQFNFQIKGIEIMNFNLNCPEIPNKPYISFTYNFNIEHRINVDSKIVLVLILSEILDEDKITKLCSLKVGYLYEVPNLLDFFDDKNKRVNFPQEVIFILNSISLSTTRGILYSNLKGTLLHNAILPIIDPKSFTSQNI
jgi:hypothetical protein